MAEQTLDLNAIEFEEWDELRHHWGWLMGVGTIWIILGILAVIMPFAATVAFELVLGAIFLVGGIAQFVQALRCREWRGRALQAVGGVIAAGLGGLLLLFPLAGILTLTLLLGAFFVVAGIIKLGTALQHRSLHGWVWVLVSGILGIAVGTLIWAGWPGSAVWFLGLLVGIELIFGGWSTVVLALAARRS